MKLKAIVLGLVACGVFSTSVSEARGTSNGILATLSGTLSRGEVEAPNGDKETTNNMVFDVKLGYLNTNGLYLGGIYTSISGETDDGTNTTKTDGSGTGASIGYVGASGFYIMGHYLFSAKKTGLDDGKGYQLDLGYLSSVSSNVVLGVEMSYRHIDYQKQNVKIGELYPMFTIGVLF